MEQPIGLDPDTTIAFTLKVFRKRPKSEQPVFLARYMTAREHLRVEALREQALVDQADLDARLSLYFDGLKIGLVGWKNLTDGERVEVPFDLDPETSRLPDVLSYTSMWELYGAVLIEAQLGELALKKSESPSPDATGSSAGTAGPGNAGT